MDFNVYMNGVCPEKKKRCILHKFYDIRRIGQREGSVDGEGLPLLRDQRSVLRRVRLHEEARPGELPLEVQGVALVLSVQRSCFQEETFVLRNGKWI